MDGLVDVALEVVVPELALLLDTVGDVDEVEPRSKYVPSCSRRPHGVTDGRAVDPLEAELLAIVKPGRLVLGRPVIVGTGGDAVLGGQAVPGGRKGEFAYVDQLGRVV